LSNISKIIKPFVEQPCAECVKHNKRKNQLFWSRRELLYHLAVDHTGENVDYIREGLN